MSLAEPQFFSVRQTCQILSLSRASIYRLLRTKRLVAVGAGGKTLITADSLKKLIADLEPLSFKAA